MAQIYFGVPILNDEGDILQELDATIDYDICVDDGNIIVEVNGFTAPSYNRDVEIEYGFNCVDKFMRTIFIRGKEFLEKSEDFYKAVEEKHEDELSYAGKGANDPDGRIIWRAA